MGINEQIADWLENRWVTPAYSGCWGNRPLFWSRHHDGWMVICFSGVFALLGWQLSTSARTLSLIRRNSIQPVSAGDQLTIELQIENQTTQSKTLLQVKICFLSFWVNLCKRR